MNNVILIYFFKFCFLFIIAIFLIMQLSDYFLRKNQYEKSIFFGIVFIIIILIIFIRISNFDIAKLSIDIPVKFLHDQYRKEITMLGNVLDCNGNMIAHNKRENGQIRRDYPFGTNLFMENDSCTNGIPCLEKIFYSHLSRPTRLLNYIIARNAKKMQVIPSGMDLSLTLDVELQNKALDLLQNKDGSIIALVPQSGDILTLVSSTQPVMKDAMFSIDALKNRVPIRRLFQLLLATFALRYNYNDTLVCAERGETSELTHNTFREPGGRYHGQVDLIEALRVNCRFYFVRLATKLYKKQGEDFNKYFLLSEREFWNSDNDKLKKSFKFTGGDSIYKIIKKQEQDLNDPVHLTPIHLALLLNSTLSDGILYRLKIEKERHSNIIYKIGEPMTGILPQIKQMSDFQNLKLPGELVKKLAKWEIIGFRDYLPDHDLEWFISFTPELFLLVVVRNANHNRFLAEDLSAEMYEQFYIK